MPAAAIRQRGRRPVGQRGTAQVDQTATARRGTGQRAPQRVLAGQRALPSELAAQRGPQRAVSQAPSGQTVRRQRARARRAWRRTAPPARRRARAFRRATVRPAGTQKGTASQEQRQRAAWAARLSSSARCGARLDVPNEKAIVEQANEMPRVEFVSPRRPSRRRPHRSKEVLAGAPPAWAPMAERSPQPTNCRSAPPA